jgi:hypothetical protein
VLGEGMVARSPVVKGIGPESERSEVRIPNWSSVKSSWYIGKDADIMNLPGIYVDFFEPRVRRASRWENTVQ